MTTESNEASAHETTNAQINDVAKESIKRRLVKAIADEKLYTNEAGALLGILPAYLSMIKNPELWSKCPILAWISAQKWINSGLSMTKFGEVNGHLVKRVEKGEKEETKKEKLPTEKEILEKKRVL
jgi:hypothetical protein